MANTETFVGRENEIQKFREEMGKLYPKTGILQKWLGKKEDFSIAIKTKLNKRIL